MWRIGVKFGSGSEGWFPFSSGERSCGMNHVLSFEFWAHKMNVQARLVQLEGCRSVEDSGGILRDATCGTPLRCSYSFIHSFMHPLPA